MRSFFAILIAKLAGFLSRKFKQGGGTTLPGLIAEKIDPNIISKLTSKIPDGAIVITGTNGKTTTAKMLAAIMAQSGHEVIYNFAGSNLSRGVASILIQHSNVFGRVRGNVAIFEVDEATMPEIASKMTPKFVLVTNLFRDQLDRYGELDKTAKIIGQALRLMPRAKVVLNADDPLVASLSSYNENVVYYGFEDKFTTKSKGAIDSKDCISCGHELVYNPRYFGHLGKYKCSNCEFARPVPAYVLSDLKPAVENSGAIFCNANKEKKEIRIQIPGIYNLYNALAAASLASELSIGPAVIAHALENVTAAFGRMEKIKMIDHDFFLLLVKNPTGFTQALETLTFDRRPKNLLFALNDNYADGTDISWIWDAEVEIISDLANVVVASGMRGEDMLLRLKYGNFNTAKITLEKNLEKALDLALSEVPIGETLYVLPTYTAMLEIRRILHERGLVKGFME
jgi:UDP-N-acetylmuramyl tripeptide synthase